MGESISENNPILEEIGNKCSINTKNIGGSISENNSILEVICNKRSINTSKI